MGHLLDLKLGINSHLNRMTSPTEQRPSLRSQSRRTARSRYRAVQPDQRAGPSRAISSVSHFASDGDPMAPTLSTRSKEPTIELQSKERIVLGNQKYSADGENRSMEVEQRITESQLPSGFKASTQGGRRL
ncbi:hypothetical protein U1Q18_009178 [Sarracenia purpurea var. burkii]